MVIGAYSAIFVSQDVPIIMQGFITSESFRVLLLCHLVKAAVSIRQSARGVGTRFNPLRRSHPSPNIQHSCPLGLIAGPCNRMICGISSLHFNR